MIDLVNYLYEKIIAVMDQWNDDDIYSVTFFVYSNEEYRYKQYNNMTDFCISYNTESYFQDVYDDKEDYYEQRWNYAYLAQEEYCIFDDECMEIILKWYDQENIDHIGEIDDDGDPIGYKELVKVITQAAKRIQEEDYMLKKFNKRIPIIIQDYEFSDILMEATEEANVHQEAEEFLNVDDDHQDFVGQSEEAAKKIQEEDDMLKKFIKSVSNIIQYYEFSDILKEATEEANVHLDFVDQSEEIEAVVSLEKVYKKAEYVMVFNKDNTIVWTTFRHKVLAYDVESAELLYQIKCLKYPSTLVLSHDERKLCIKNTSGHIVVFDLEEQKIIMKDTHDGNEFHVPIFTKDDQYLIDDDREGHVYKIDIKNNQKTLIYKKRNDISKCYFDEKEDRLYFYSEYELEIIDINGNLISIESIPFKFGNSSVTENYIFQVTYDIKDDIRYLALYDRKTMEELRRMEYSTYALDVEIGENEQYIVMYISMMEEIIILDIKTFKIIKKYIGKIMSTQNMTHYDEKHKCFYIISSGIYRDTNIRIGD